MATDAEDDWLIVGRIVGPFGVGGEMKIESLTDFPDRLMQRTVVYIGDERRPFGIQGSRQHKHVLLRLEGVTSPEMVDALRGEYLWIPRSEAMPLPEGQYYLDQVIGLEVYTVAGESLGRVQDILPTGSNDVYVVQGARGEVLIPAIHDVVRELDVGQGRIIVEAIEGLLE